MESDEVDKTRAEGTLDSIDSRGAVNSLILDYYKKFGRKRDLEQYFSLSTAQSDIKDTSGTFWRKMKSENDSSDSGGQKSDSSHEVCRISIRCSLPEPSSSQEDEPRTKTDSPQTESPPIILEEPPAEVSRHTDEESINFDDNNSQKSLDALLDLSAHKPLSPTSSITSQRKLEWDSLADVGYANESDRKNSASSLSTLERLALKQQYSHNDSNQNIGQPTSQSTPIEDNEGKSKIKKGLGKKTTKIYKKDVDFVEVNVPHTSDTNQAPSINVNLTKHISFNVEKDGAITVDDVKRDISISPEKVSAQTLTQYLGMDKEIQTSLPKDKPSTKDKSSSMDEMPKTVDYNQKIPVMISLNTLRKRLRKRKSRVVRKKLRTKKKVKESKEVTPQEKSGEQLSEAESFEYMPGHMYNQNQLKDMEPRPDNSTAGNKSSLESSGPPTTDSSKASKHSLTKDLEKCVELLKDTLKQRYDDSNTKKQLIKNIVRRLVNSKYRDDDTTTEFLSGLSYNSEKLGIKGNNTTTSTSDANNTEDSGKSKPKKSILRNEKFNANAVASTSQSAPNLFSASSDKVNTALMKKMTSNSESDYSSRGKISPENACPKTSSEELYLKYLEALRREEAYKKHLKDKEMFLKQKLVSSETSFKAPIRQEAKISSRLKDLMKDLTRNNYDDGSGDASKLEGGSSSNMDLGRFNPVRSQRSHSVFTLSSSHSEPKRPNLKKKMQAEREISEAGPSRDHYCCCPHHYLNTDVGCTDSSVQVNIKHHCDAATNEKPSQTKPKACPLVPSELKKLKPESPRCTRVVPDNATGEIKYVCLCKGKPISTSDVGENIMIYKCSKLTNRGVQLEEPSRLFNTGIQCAFCMPIKDDKIELIQPLCKMNTATDSSSSDNTSNARRYSKSSQTDIVVRMGQGSVDKYSVTSGSVKNLCGTSTKCVLEPTNPEKYVTIHEATRCLQTEISIDPRISDPTLSDINIISDCECAKLVAEQLRKVSIRSSDKSDGAKTYSDVCTNSGSDRLLMPSIESIFKDEDKSSNYYTDDREVAINNDKPIAIGNDYTLPIKGTNMTLTVNLGGVEINKKPEQVNQGIVTEKISNVDEATSANGDCTKSAQCSAQCTSYKIMSDEPTQNKNTSCCSKKMSKVNDPKCNTYPKEIPIKDKTPFKRCNTDTDTLHCAFVQTDCIKTKDVETNNNRKINFDSKQKNNVQTSDNECQVTNSLCCVNKNKQDNKNDKKCADPIVDSESGCSKCVKIKSQFNTEKKTIGIQKDLCDEEQQTEKKTKNVDVGTTEIITKNVGVVTEEETGPEIRTSCCGVQTDAEPKKNSQEDDPKTSSSECGPKDTPKPKDSCCSKMSSPTDFNKDPIIGMIQDMTRRYSKKDIVKIKKKKCFTEIMTVLNYLLETEDSTDPEPKTCCSTSTDTKSSSNLSKRQKMSDGDCSDKRVDKSVQLSSKKSRKNKVVTESSDLPCSSDLPTTSSDSAACKVLNKIKKECEKYHQRKCKGGRKCEASSSTSINCEKCKKVHHCPCRNHKCKRSKTFEKLQKKCIAYNLIIQTSESMLSEETVCEKKCRPLQSIVVKVPKRKDSGKKEAYKPDKESHSPRMNKNRSRSCPNECETSDEYARRVELATVREYLEQNRPDFVQNTSQRQNCLKFISERRTQEPCSPRLKMVVVHKPRCMGNVASTPVYCGGMCYKRCDTADPCIPYETEQCSPCSPCNPCNPCEPNPCNPCVDPCIRTVHTRLANERAAHRDMLSLRMEQQPDLTNLSSDELRLLAQQIGLDLRRKKPAPKFISEREMKKHSEDIYKTLPEVVQKKEEKKKENIKKTNLLMANLFKKNLQKKTLRGSVNLSNYSPVIKI